MEDVVASGTNDPKNKIVEAICRLSAVKCSEAVDASVAKNVTNHRTHTTTLTLPKIAAAVDATYRDAAQDWPTGADAVRLVERLARAYGYGDDCLRGGRRRL